MTAPSLKPRRFKIHFRWWKRSYSIALVTLLALALRLWAAWQLPLDADEPVYMRAASDYADLMARGDWSGIVNYQGNAEHPPLVKLLYSIPFQLFDPPFGESPELLFNRIVSAVLGTIAVFLLSLIDPLAGLFLAFHSMAIKYTSEVYLEALPLAAIIGSVLALERASKRPPPLVLAFGSAVRDCHSRKNDLWHDCICPGLFLAFKTPNSLEAVAALWRCGFSLVLGF